VLAARPIRRLDNNLCRLSASAITVYSQLISVSGDGQDIRMYGGERRALGALLGVMKDMA